MGLAANRQWELIADENWDCQHLCKENVNQVAFFREVMGEKVLKWLLAGKRWGEMAVPMQGTEPRLGA